jgi:signal-transduction protein with cAMP-binding, CBS, and nucleotidyltransferase domain
MRTAEEVLKEKGMKIYSVESGSTIEYAILKMCNYNIGSILIEKDGNIIGIWTERDLLYNVKDGDLNPKTAIIDDYMTKNLIFADADETVFNLMDKYLGKHLRHLLIKKGENIIGILSTGDVLKASLNAKSDELNKLHAMVSWEYYSNWRWEK